LEQLTALLLNWGWMGLLIAAFTESFCSPIFPDLILIPLALAHPESAVIYGVIATIASALGGIIGYGIGFKLGGPAARRIIPDKYAEKVHFYAQNNAKWAIFLAALSPIPYKFVSITAGALKISFPVFLIISIIGRGKRFLLEGLLIYYYGPTAERLLNQYSDEMLMITMIVLVLAVLGIYYVRRLKKTALAERL